MGAKVLVLFLVAYYMTAGVRKAWRPKSDVSAAFICHAGGPCMSVSGVSHYCSCGTNKRGLEEADTGA